MTTPKPPRGSTEAPPEHGVEVYDARDAERVHYKGVTTNAAGSLVKAPSGSLMVPPVQAEAYRVFRKRAGWGGQGDEQEVKAFFGGYKAGKEACEAETRNSARFPQEERKAVYEEAYKDGLNQGEAVVWEHVSGLLRMAGYPVPAGDDVSRALRLTLGVGVKGEIKSPKGERKAEEIAAVDPVEAIMHGAEALLRKAEQATEESLRIATLLRTKEEELARAIAAAASAEAVSEADRRDAQRYRAARELFTK